MTQIQSYDATLYDIEANAKANANTNTNANTNHYEHAHFHDIDEHHECGTESPTLYQKTLIAETVSNYKKKLRFQRTTNHTDTDTDIDTDIDEHTHTDEMTIHNHFEFDVHFHILIDNFGNGNIADEIVQHSIDLLNEGFSGDMRRRTTDCFGQTMSGIDTSIRFILKNITRTVREEWYDVRNHDFETQVDESDMLRMGNCSTLNVYTMKSDLYGGWASGPIMCNPDQISFMDGVWIDYTSLPKSTCSQERPVVLIHEAGHWVGLDHVFEGECEDYFGDGVKDTPNQKQVSKGCPIGSDTCPGGGKDSIHNFMAYTDRCCKYSFTEGQIVRMHALLDRWRSDSYRPPSIYDDFYEYYDDDDHHG